MIQRLIDNNQIKIFFQPIISLKNNKILAFEALTRAYDGNEELISPIELFIQASKENLSNTLDSYVRELALIKFFKYYKNDNDLILFLNFESTFIDSEEHNDFLETVQKYNINPSNIVLEIKEDEIRDNNSIKKFVDFYKKHGFIIAIDDFGTGYSSFDRLALIKPDIVKIDRSLIYNVNQNFVNSEILRALANMCHKIGALVLAEGVESESEILECMLKEVDVFQGFFFSKPKDSIDAYINDTIYSSIKKIGISYKQNINTVIQNKKIILNESKELSEEITNILNNTKDNEKLKKVISSNERLEAIYIIDYMTGLQINDTISNIDESTLFKAMQKGHDHSLKGYFFIAKNSSRSDYLSSIYVSKASGNICRTYSSIIQIKNIKYILCLDIINNEEF
jgi:EAL domain-containing protein (putative c-di-GMP-specific phosphodiesterase class I)